MREKELHCIDPQLHSAIGLEIVMQGGFGRPLSLSEPFSRHLECCEACRECLPLWIEKGYGARLSSREGEILRLAAEGDERILRKVTKEGTALFRVYDENSQVGLMVIIGDKDPFDVRNVQQMTREEFDKWEG